MREVPVPISNGGINGSKFVIKHMTLKDKRNSCVMTRKRLVKNNLHHKRTDFISLLSSKSSDQRRVAKLLHNNSGDRISPLSNGEEGFSSDQVTKDVATILNNGLKELGSRKGRERNRDAKVDRVVLLSHRLPIRPTDVRSVLPKAKANSFRASIKRPGLIPFAGKVKFFLEREITIFGIFKK